MTTVFKKPPGIVPPPVNRPKPPGNFLRPNIRPVNNIAKIVMSSRILLDPDEITGKSIAIMGTNGSGKSGTTRRMMEEHVRMKLPFAVIDIENEYVTLKELGEVILAGPPIDYGAFKVDVPLTNSTEYHEFARECYEESKSVVLLLGDIDDDTRKIYLKAFIDGLFEAANNPRTAHYYRLFIEEVQEYIPQVGLAKSDPLRQSIIRFGKRGRKRKLSLVLVSQRPSNVDKDVLTQCHVFFLHFVTYSTDIDVYQNALGVDNAADKMKTMTPGDVIFLFGRQHIESERIVKPKTISPWDESEKLDTSKFVQVDVEEIREHVAAEGKKDEGMTVVQTSYLNGLKEEVEKLGIDVQGLVDLCASQEEQIVELKARPMIATSGEYGEDAHAIISDLKTKNATLEKLAYPVRLLTEILQERMVS